MAGDRSSAVQRPALVIAHNKTLAAQLCNEFREFFPRERGRVLRQLLRLLPARGLRPGAGPLHREGLVDQRRDRPAAPRRHRGAARPPRRDHRRLGLVHLRHRLARALPRADAAVQGRRVGRPRRRSSASWSACSTRATTPTSPAAPSASKGEVLEIFPAYAETAYRIAPVRRRGRGDPALRPADRRDPRRDRPRRGLAGDATTSPRRRRSSARSCEIKHELDERVAWFEEQRQAARGAPAPAAHRVRHRDAEGARLLPRDRELLADPRRPPAGQPAAHADRLLPRRLRRLRRRVAPDDPAARRHVRGRPLAQADAGRLRLPPAVGDRQPAAPVRRVPRPGRADGDGLGDARRVRARHRRRGSSSRSCARPGSSTPRSRCARRATRSTT